MKSVLFLAFAVFSASVTAKMPAISGVSVSQPKSDNYKNVVIGYSLEGGDAIVTADILTNGVSIGAQCFQSLSGDVNCLVPEGIGKSIIWEIKRDWPNRKCEVSVKLTAWLPGAAPDYMVIDIADGSKRFYASADDVPYTVTNIVYKTDKIVMRRIPAAGVTWRMGQPIGGEKCDGKYGNVMKELLRDNETAHLVSFSEDYYIGIFEVTQRQYYRLAGSFPSSRKIGSSADLYDGSKGFPVEQVSYNDLRGATSDEFEGWPQNGHVLGEGAKLKIFREKLGLESIDLPTEAQWEFACRAGTTSALNSGKECGNPKTGQADGNIESLAWYYGNAHGNTGTVLYSGAGPREVGLKQENAWGLYDMHGNVHEWCLDWLSLGDGYRATFADDWSTGGVTMDPVGAQSGDKRIVRGGDYFYSSAWARSACRSGYQTLPDNRTMHCGFRIVCSGTLD